MIRFYGCSSNNLRINVVKGSITQTYIGSTGTKIPGEVLVRVEGVSKKFCRSLKKSLWYGMQDMAHELNPFASRTSADEGRRIVCPPESSSALRPDEFWAVKNVSFELRRGECLGLVGRNGAGKTTLLKMLNGLIKPDTGRIEMRGKVGALIALGAGFNPILSGRENVYVNAAVLGLGKKDIEEKIEEIIDFAEIGEFIDAPVQSYSSGMQVRLGFAVATALDPDVLILDEVLAVGDAAFRLKCYHRINKLIKDSAVILVTHSMDHVTSTASAVGMMQKGNYLHFASVTEGIAAYNKENDDGLVTEAEGGAVFALHHPITKANLRILDPIVSYGDRLEVEVELECSEPIPEIRMAFRAANQRGDDIMSWDSNRYDESVELPSGAVLLRFAVKPLLLHNGIYHWSFYIYRNHTLECLVMMTKCGSFSVQNTFQAHSGIAYLPDLTPIEVLPLPTATIPLINQNNGSLPIK